MNKEIYQIIALNIPDLIVIIDEENKINFISSNVHEILGYMPEEVQNKDMDFLVHKQNKSVFQRNSKSRDKFEVKLLCKDGSEKVFELTAKDVDISDEKKVLYSFHEVSSDGYYDSETRNLIENHALFQDRINQAVAKAKRSGKSVGVLSIDLDIINNIPNTQDENFEEKVIAEAGNLIAKNLRETDTVTRQGNDEYLVILSELTKEEDAELVAQKIFDALLDEFTVEGKQISLVTFTGISVYPTDTNNLESLILNADVARTEARDKDLSFHRVNQNDVQSDDLISIFK